MLPADYVSGKRYPLIVYQYPGDTKSKLLNHYGLSTENSAIENWQLLASRCYAVLLSDVPVRRGTNLSDIAKAILPGLDKVIELGVADRDRLGAIGISSGGYAVMCLLVQTTRFKAAV